MNIRVRIIIFLGLMVSSIVAVSVNQQYQLTLEALQDQQIFLEQQLALLQKKELATLTNALQESIDKLDNLESKQLLEVDQTFITNAQQYSTLLDALSLPRTSFYYDVFFWVYYVPTFIAQETIQDLEKQKLLFPLSSQQQTLATTFSQFYYTYKSFFEQWPADLQKSSTYYAKAKDAYGAFGTTQAFVASLLARQQDITATENQLKVLINTFTEALYNGESIALDDKSKYEHALSVYSSQLKDTTSQQYKQYLLWSYIASLMYYQDLAGLPRPTNKTNAELFVQTYGLLNGLMDTYNEEWMYYEDGKGALDVFYVYNDACKKLLNAENKPKPITPQPKPVVPVESEPTSEPIKPTPGIPEPRPLPIEPVKPEPTEPKDNPTPAPVGPPHEEPQPVEPKPTPEPVTPTPVVPEPVPPVKITISESLDNFIQASFDDESLQSLSLTVFENTLVLYKNLLQDYKDSSEYRETDEQLYQLWVDFLPVRYNQLRVIGLDGISDKNKKGIVAAYNAARNKFMNTASYKSMLKAYPELAKELTLTAYYGNWMLNHS